MELHPWSQNGLATPSPNCCCILSRSRKAALEDAGTLQSRRELGVEPAVEWGKLPYRSRNTFHPCKHNRIQFNWMSLNHFAVGLLLVIFGNVII